MKIEKVKVEKKALRILMQTSMEWAAEYGFSDPNSATEVANAVEIAYAAYVQQTLDEESAIKQWLNDET